MSSATTDSRAPAGSKDDLSFWGSVLHALKGEHHDYTQAPLNRAVLLLAVPMVLEMVMESLFSVSDVFWVSHLGKEAVAVVGLTESVMTLVYAVAIGVSMAAMAVVARRVGEKAIEKAQESAGQSLLLGAAVALAMGAVLGSGSTRIMEWMGADAATIQIGGSFARVMLGGNITVFMIFLINAIFRGAGDPVFAMRTLWLANGLNIVLGPCFVFGLGPFPRLGVLGAAVATNIGRGVGVLYQLWHLSGNHSRIQIKLHQLAPKWDVIAGILRPAWSGIAQYLITTTSWVGLFKILALFGSSAMAGYTIAIRLVVSMLMPAWGLASAGATLVGQNLGAQQPGRAVESVKIAVWANVKFLSTVGILFLLTGPWIVDAFTKDPVVHGYAVQTLRLISLAFPMYAAGMCFESAFNGAGDTWTPTKLNFLCFWVIQIPLAWILARPLGLGPLGVFIAVPSSYSILATLSFVMFRRGAWKQRKL